MNKVIQTHDAGNPKVSRKGGVRTTTYTWTPFELAVNKMTNWQRSQWAKAKYPGLAHKEVEKLKPFLERKKK
jgi:hypothetical protein